MEHREIGTAWEIKEEIFAYLQAIVEYIDYLETCDSYISQMDTWVAKKDVFE